MKNAWAGELPQGWRSTSLKWLAKIFAGGTPDREVADYWRDGEVPWLNSGAVNDWVINEPSTYITQLGLARSSATLIPRGSVLVALAGQGKTKGMSARLEIESSCNQSMAAIVPGSELNYRYLHYWLSANYKSVRSLGGGDVRDGLNLRHIGGIDTPIPDLEEQRRIADFLDDRVSRIDKILAARRQQISCARSLPWAAFDKHVAESGAGPVPLRRAISFISDGPFGSAFTSDDYVDVGPIAIRLGNIGFAEFRTDDVIRVPSEIYESHPRTHVRPGDLLVASLGDNSNHAGRACVAPDDIGPAMVKGKCYVARPNPSAALAQYLARALSSPSGAAQLARAGRGATRNMLNLELLLATPFLLPSFEQQMRIVRRAGEVESESERAVSSLTQSSARLTEYKQSLITAAVTGQFDVTTASTEVPA